MTRLIKSELHKIFQSRFFRTALAVLLCVNLFLLWVVTNPLSGAYSSAAYKKMQSNLSGLTMTEKQAFIDEELRRITAFSVVDSVLRTEAYDSGKHNEYMREQYAAELAEFYDEYMGGGFLKYNTTIANEYKFLHKIKAECDTVAGYNAFLDDIEKKAKQLSGISIFAQSADGYDLRNIEKTALAYEGMRGIAIDYFPQMGVFTALDFELTDLVAVFVMLLIATVLVRTERDNGLLALIRATPAGRLKTAAAKLFALGGGLLAALLLLYGVNLLYCGGIYGLGDLSRSIQSVPALMRSTLKLNVLQYFALFIITKWAAAMASGVFVMLCMLFAKRAYFGYIGALSFLGGNLFIRAIIPATSNLNVIKYANLISLLRTNELIGGYRNLYFFAHPVSIWSVEAITAIICLVIFTAAFCAVFCFSALSSPKPLTINLFKRFRLNPRKFTTITRREAHKLLFMNGALLFVLVFAGYQIYSAVVSQSYINADEIYYSYYIKLVEGPVTAEKLSLLREEYKEFKPIIELESAYRKGEISSEQYNMASFSYSSLQQKMSAFYRVWYKQGYINEHPRAEFVYESGWLNLFDIPQNGNGNRLDALLASLLAAACFSGLFAMEKQTGMERIIAAAPLGRSATVKAKLRCCAALCGVLSVLSFAPRFICTVRDYGLGAFFAPIYSIEVFSKMPELPLVFYFLAILAARYLALRAIAGVTLMLSHKSGNMFSALFISSAIFSVPLLLSVSGLENAKWLSMYPLFHITALLAEGGGMLIAIFILLALCIIYICNYYLNERFGAVS